MQLFRLTVLSQRIWPWLNLWSSTSRCHNWLIHVDSLQIRPYYKCKKLTYHDHRDTILHRFDIDGGLVSRSDNWYVYIACSSTSLAQTKPSQEGTNQISLDFHQTTVWSSRLRIHSKNIVSLVTLVTGNRRLAWQSRWELPRLIYRTEGFCRRAFDWLSKNSSNMRWTAVLSDLLTRNHDQYQNKDRIPMIVCKLIFAL